MTPRSLFVIVIRLLGLYLIWEAFATFFSFASTVAIAAQSDNSEDLYLALIIATLAIGFLVGLILMCLYYPNRIVDKLSLDTGFSETLFDINPHRSTVLLVAIIVTGMLLLVNAIPILCQQFIAYVQQMNSGDSSVKEYIVLYGIKTLLGYFMLTNSRRIAATIEKSRRG